MRLRRRQVSWLAGPSPPSAFPELQGSSGRLREARRLQLRGQPRASGSPPTPRVPFFFVPHHAGTDDADDYSRRTRARKRGKPLSPCIDKGGPGSLKWPCSAVSRKRANRERGRGLAPKIRGCPRNCERRASSLNSHWEGSREGGKGEDPQARRPTAESGRLPGGVPRRRLVGRRPFAFSRRGPPRAPCKLRPLAEERRSG